MTYTVVLPYIYEPYKDACMKTCKLENVLLVDNTVNNVGIMRAHNMGIEKMRSDNSDWLIIMSAAVRFGEKGGLDFIEALEQRPNDLVVEAAGVFGWHLIAFSRQVIEKVGKWDENFTPYGYDDLDYAYRIQLAFGLEDRSKLWQKAIIDVKDVGMAHSIHKAGLVTRDEKFLRDYYARKWGGMTGKERFKHPFDNPNLDVSFWPVASNGGASHV